MKKTLIALAAAAVGTAALAQNVTISGVLNVSAYAGAKDERQAAAATAKTATKLAQTGPHNTLSTSNINFTASEDLGGGLSATAVMISGVGDGFAARERTIAIGGGFGTIKMGRFVPAAASGFHGYTQAGTANIPGSIYFIQTPSAATALNPHHRDTVTGSYERQNNVIQYTTPDLGGLTVNMAVASASVDSNAAADTGKESSSQTSFHIGYATGPLSVGAGMNSRKVNRETDAGVARADGVLGAAAVVRASNSGNLNWFGGSYDFGVATVGLARVTRTADNDLTNLAVSDVTLSSMGITVPMGALTFKFTMSSGKDAAAAGTADNMKLKGNQVHIGYALSKRTTVAFATGSNTYGRDGAAALATATRKISATTVGVTHSF